MKKFSFVLGALALATVAFVSCDEKNGDNNYGDVEDGFYVAGAATGFDNLDSKLMMTAGTNEVTKTKRDGMYEKYVVLEAGKDFELLLFEAGQKTRYSADLREVTLTAEDLLSEAYADNPQTTFFKGSLATGASAPAMKVSKTALYHIVLDLDKTGDLANAGGAQIIICPCEWGVRGAMNSWGYTAMTAEGTLSNKSAITYTLKDADMPANGEFKFAYGHAWKITLDDAGKVKAEISFGGELDAPVSGGSNFKLTDAGLYDITLTFNLASGALGKSFKAAATLTKKSELPTEMYMIGDAIKGWDWAAGHGLAMIPAHSEPGTFWAIRYIADATKSFKFCPKQEWSGDFTGLTTNEGYTVANGNCNVAEAGLYMFEVDMKNEVVKVHKAEVFGMGDAFGGWNEGAAPYTVNAADGTVSIKATAAGNMRTYAKSELDGTAGNWWHREFIVDGGNIVYRACGGDPAAIALTAGQTVTLDFNAGTGSIK